MIKVKICGITRLSDALLAAELGAWATGFIFYPKSPRYIKPEEAATIIRALPESLKKVGVFVNSKAEEIDKIIKITGITTVQLHGDEKADIINKIPAEVIKAFRPEKTEDLHQIKNYQKSGFRNFLIDASVKGQYGGTGVKADKELAILAKEYGKIILAGGISAENANSLINEVKPYAIDLSSSLEISPGIKDKNKLRELFLEIKD